MPYGRSGRLRAACPLHAVACALVIVAAILAGGARLALLPTRRSNRAGRDDIKDEKQLHPDRKGRGTLLSA